ncbi:hypothetical protein GCM10027598_21700 [Amycolatopsis oliviviridis]|uniref:Cysteine desulfurase n=1 Tax=Amycolatopsis oliviviridis TaxID=1471590 RepID=A0ABQ3LG27_9PSEU|nr:hypothetical protein GCM10017790_29340 [Amycolatopsis oliviviridis]
MRESCLDLLRPLEPGWNSVVHREGWDNPAYVPDVTARRLEGGMPNVAGIGATVLSDRDAGYRSGIVSVHVDGIPAPLPTERLKARGIACSARSGGLRISPHGYNTEEEIDRLIAAVREIAA